MITPLLFLLAFLALVYMAVYVVYGDGRRAFRGALALSGLLVLALYSLGCSRATGPTPVAVATATPPPACNIVVNGDNNNVNGCGNVITAPVTSPSPKTNFPTPDYIKISLYGDQKCEPGVTPSTEDKTLRVKCTIAMTISPKCKRVPPDVGPDVDCKIPDNAEPESFGVISGADHVTVTPQGDNPRFNRNVVGVSAGEATFSGAYQGIPVREVFVLKVVN